MYFVSNDKNKAVQSINQYFQSSDLGIVILSVFMAPDRFVLTASRNKSHQKLLTCFSGRAALGLSIHENNCRNGQICPFSFKGINHV